MCRWKCPLCLHICLSYILPFLSKEPKAAYSHHLNNLKLQTHGTCKMQAHAAGNMCEKHDCIDWLVMWASPIESAPFFFVEGTVSGGGNLWPSSTTPISPSMYDQWPGMVGVLVQQHLEGQRFLILALLHTLQHPTDQKQDARILVQHSSESWLICVAAQDQKNKCLLVRRQS